MAFGLQYLARVEQTQQYDKTLNVPNGCAANPIPTVWVYNASATGSNDSSATAQTANYFNGANGYLTIGDMVYLYANDPTVHILWVSANAGGNVSTTQLV
jgi:hypothetical protein